MCTHPYTFLSYPFEKACSTRQKSGTSDLCICVLISIISLSCHKRKKASSETALTIITRCLLRIWPHIQNAQWDIYLLKENPNPNFHVWFWSQALVRLQLTKGHMEKCMTWELAIQTFMRSWAHRNAILQDLTVKVGAFWEWQPLQIKIKSVNEEHIPQQKQDLWKNPKSRSVQGFVQPYCQDLWL